MRINAAVLQFADELALVNEAESAAKFFENLISRFGFGCFCAGRVSSEQRRAFGGKIWAQSQHAWIDHWNREHYAKVDPIAWFWRKHENHTVVTWSRAKRLDCGPRPDLFEEAREFGLREGVAAGVKIPSGDFAAVSIATAEREIGPDDRLVLGYATLLLASRLSLLCECHQAEEILTERQRECLTWAASGKTDWEISQILGLSQRTVQEHVARCVAKLHATNRAHAISIALLDHHITP